MPILAVFLFCNGAQINVKSAGIPLAKGVILTAIKFVIGAALGIIVNSLWGPEGILGLTPLALIGAITNSNGGLYSALAGGVRRFQRRRRCPPSSPSTTARS